MPSKRAARQRQAEAAHVLASETAPPSGLRCNAALRLCRDTDDIDTIIDLTRHPDPQVRQRALREMCPCRVKLDLTEFWSRVLQMTADPASNVRKQVLHTICDGSPRHMEHSVSSALEDFNRDEDSEIRRMAHKALTSYHRTGKWNVL